MPTRCTFYHANPFTILLNPCKVREADEDETGEGDEGQSHHHTTLLLSLSYAYCDKMITPSPSPDDEGFPGAIEPDEHPREDAIRIGNLDQKALITVDEPTRVVLTDSDGDQVDYWIEDRAEVNVSMLSPGAIEVQYGEEEVSHVAGYTGMHGFQYVEPDPRIGLMLTRDGAMGTAFLFEDQYVMTNQHVLASDMPFHFYSGHEGPLFFGKGGLRGDESWRYQPDNHWVSTDIAIGKLDEPVELPGSLEPFELDFSANASGPVEMAGYGISYIDQGAGYYPWGVEGEIDYYGSMIDYDRRDGGLDQYGSTGGHSGSPILQGDQVVGVHGYSGMFGPSLNAKVRAWIADIGGILDGEGMAIA